MGILLAFTPFVLFAVIDRWVGVASGLAAGTALSAALVLRDWLWRRRSVKLLELGTLLLFGGLTLVAVVLQPDWPLMAVRLSLDSGLLLIALVSLAIGRPFTLQYAREQVPPAFWASPLFLRANQVITAVWAACFLVIVAADLLLFYVPDVPAYVGIAATVAALGGAIRFTTWYPAHLRRSAAGGPASRTGPTPTLPGAPPLR